MAQVLCPRAGQEDNPSPDNLTKRSGRGSARQEGSKHTAMHEAPPSPGPPLGFAYAATLP